MATIQWAEIQQSTTEKRGWIADFTGDLALGVTVASGTAVHTPPSGNALTPTVTANSPYITATLDKPTVVGVHYLDITATYSTGETGAVRIVFAVGYAPTQARAGMVDLVGQLRQMGDAGPDDYTVAGVPYWSDAQLQVLLDRHRTYLQQQPMTAHPDYANGTVTFKTYDIPGWRNFETAASGTSIFYVQDGNFIAIGTAAYTPDYAAGIVTFGSSTLGSAVMVTGYSYDLNAAAADLWRQKAASVAKAYDFSTDNHNLRRSQLMAQYRDMAKFYQAQSRPRVVVMERSDI